ncbi:hypothetical protein L2E82_31560 [Cichorium intybus]|uniref:Uncharacterized protein n=1 Tax=Cichorium intybus TaxID=13427 RepID=A0ACB9BFK4_CICIN|nr:hypothetical protein L2E82_31560 [Cichorium intybus]
MERYFYREKKERGEEIVGYTHRHREHIHTDHPTPLSPYATTFYFSPFLVSRSIPSRISRSVSFILLPPSFFPQLPNSPSFPFGFNSLPHALREKKGIWVFDCFLTISHESIIQIHPHTSSDFFDLHQQIFLGSLLLTYFLDCIKGRVSILIPVSVLMHMWHEVCFLETEQGTLPRA